jgi:hypothetical protein
MINELSLNLFIYSASFYISIVNAIPYASWFILGPHLGSKVFPAAHAGNIIIKMGGKPLINGHLNHTNCNHNINSLILNSIFHNMKHIFFANRTLALKEATNSTKHPKKNENYNEILEKPFIFNL